MKIVPLLVICAVAPLTGCGLSDQYSFMPKLLKQPSAPPPQLEPEPDTKALIRVGAETLFTGRPSALAVSPVRRNALGPGFTVCVKAVTTGPLDNGLHSTTLLVAIEHGKLADRHRAAPQDRCETETYDDIEVVQ
jgi:hypothetical protein